MLFLTVYTALLLLCLMATNQPEEQLEYDDFVGLTVGSLKDFLALRGLKKTGKKVELVVRGFGAYELGIPKKFTQEQMLDTIKNEYAKRLETNRIKSDPINCLATSFGKTMSYYGHMMMMVNFFVIYST